MKIDGKSGTRTEIPFSEPVMDFLSALSERIKSDDLLRSDEEIRAFGSGAGWQILNGTGISIQGMTSGWGEVLSFTSLRLIFRRCSPGPWRLACWPIIPTSSVFHPEQPDQGMRLKELIGQMLSEEKKSSLPGFPGGNL